MDNYTNLNYNIDYIPSELSSKISCNNMSILSASYINKQNDIFTNGFNFEDCQKHHDFQKEVKSIKTLESGLLKGFEVNKKSCIYKRPHYGSGNWTNQFDSSLKDHEYMYNLQTQAKGQKEGIKCDYKNIQLPNLDPCNDNKFFTYSKTFTNDFYNCVI